MAGCPAAVVDYRNPDATRRPLPAGQYDLVAVLDTTAAINPSTGAASVLVSKPLPVEVWQ